MLSLETSSLIWGRPHSVALWSNSSVSSNIPIFSPQSSSFPSCCGIVCSSIALCYLFSTSLFVSPFFFLTIPLCYPRLLHFFPFLIILSGGGTLNVWEWRHAQVLEKEHRPKTTEHMPYNLNTLDGMRLRIAVRSQSWLAWLQDLWKFGSGWERWHRQKHSHWQSGRQTARHCASQTDSLQRRLPQHPVLALYRPLSISLSQFLLLFIRTEAPSLCYVSKQRLWISSMRKGKGEKKIGTV